MTPPPGDCGVARQQNRRQRGISPLDVPAAVSSGTSSAEWPHAAAGRGAVGFLLTASYCSSFDREHCSRTYRDQPVKCGMEMYESSCV